MSDDPRDAVVIERSFDAPVATLWSMWTDPDHFAEWYGPTGSTIPVSEIDLRVGGSRRVCMEMPGPDGPMQMWFTGEFVEIVEHERLVYTEAVSDATGRVLTAAEMGMSEAHPIETEVRVEFRAVGDRTEMVMTHLGVPADSPGAAGWGMAFDALEARLA